MAQRKGTVLDGLNLVDKFLFDETIKNKEAFEAIASIVMSEDIYQYEGNKQRSVFTGVSGFL